MTWRIEIKKRDNIEGEGLVKDIQDFGINVDSVNVIYVYYLAGNITQKNIQLIAAELLTDKVWETYEIFQDSEVKVLNNNSQITNHQLPSTNSYEVEVAYNPGVMDPVEASALKGIHDLGIPGVESIKTAKKYIIIGNLTKEELDTICNKLLLNKTVQHIVAEGENIFLPSASYSFKLIHIDLLNATDKKLLQISKESQLWLNLEEMKSIQEYYQRLARNPTDIELETLAQTWSEHCVHKTFKSKIELFTGGESTSGGNGKMIEPLFTTIKKVTEELNPYWCVSVFKDNAGVIKFGEGYDVCFKVETHNHPSALEPYGGAGTGIGGVIRDPLGTGLGAKPILNTDVFCFGPPDYPYEKLPPGTLHPKRVMKGVVAGVRDYGNKMGIPTTNGAVLFDERYLGNPVVYCGNVGLMPEKKSEKNIIPGDLIVLIGGKTGRDGIHGVTFASGELTQESETISSGSVQIGNPITEKKAVDILMQSRDKGLYRAITDCGGGGLSSAVGELASKTGARVNLEKVPLKYQGLSYTEIWISEAQERMIIFVPPEKLNELLLLCQDEDVEATVIGELTGDKRLHLQYKGETVGDLDMEFLHQGTPLPVKRAVWEKSWFPDPDSADPEDLTPYLSKILSSWNVCSKEWVIRQYDHEVQGGSVCKPLVGNNGPGDASIVKPLLGSDRGIVTSCGINPKYGEIDPYWMAAAAIDEALRNIVAVGGNPEKVALLDNFSWGNPDNPERLGELVRAVQGCYYAAKGYGVPFISGKDSLNNEYRVGNKTISIPPTLLISAIGVVENVNNCISMDLKASQDLIYIVGTTYDELGGSHYYEIQGYIGNKVPQVKPQAGKELLLALHKTIQKGLVKACHDCSEGGIGVACAEMAFAGGIGMQILLKSVPVADKNITRNDTILFSESNTRFIVEVSPENRDEFERVMMGYIFSKIGTTIENDELTVFGLNGYPIVKAKLNELKEAWQKPLRLGRQ